LDFDEVMIEQLDQSESSMDMLNLIIAQGSQLRLAFGMYAGPYIGGSSARLRSDTFGTSPCDQSQEMTDPAVGLVRDWYESLTIRLVDEMERLHRAFDRVKEFPALLPDKRVRWIELLAAVEKALEGYTGCGPLTDG
jgi:hypothetical protein